MAQYFDPTKESISKKSLNENIPNISDTEVPSQEPPDNSVGQFQAGLAGIASGLLKIPEGFVSLGAELMDATGMTSEAAAKVEAAFDFINPFEEIAEQAAAGKILEAIVSVGVPAGAGAKLATTLANKALKAKRMGTYVNLRGKNVRKGMEQVYKLNDKDIQNTSPYALIYRIDLKFREGINHG